MPRPQLHRAGRAAALALCAAGMIHASSAQAATITMTSSNSTSGSSWATSTAWSDSLAAHAGDDYLVSGSTFTVRSPVYTTNVTTRTFPGDSLTVDSAQFNLNAAFNPAGTGTVVVNNLTLRNGAAVVNAIIDSTHILSGTLNVSDSGTVYIRTAKGATSGGGLRHITVDAQMSGASTVHLLQGGTITIANAANTFSGTWKVGGSATVLGLVQDSGAGRITTLKAAAGLGNSSSVVLDPFSNLDADYDWSTSGSLTINASALVSLDQNLNVGALTIDGTSYGGGTYSFAALNTSHDALFAEGGTGSITVVPEPTSLLAFAAVAGLALVRHRRA